jgi:hypothetical protein
MAMRTQDEILRQINALKKMRATINPDSLFGGGTIDNIDAQLDVLEGRAKPNDFWIDESSEEYSDGDNDTYFEAERAEMWLHGQLNEDLADEESY